MRQPPEFLTASEVAERLRVEPSTVYRWAREDVLASVTVGGVVRFPADAVDRLIEAGRRDTTQAAS